MWKDMNIKHSLLSPLQSMGKHFCKEARSFAWGNKPFWANLWGNVLRGDKWSDRTSGGESMVKRFQRSSEVSFPLIDPELRYWYIIWKVNTISRGLNLKNTFCTPLGLGISCKACLFLREIFSAVKKWSREKFIFHAIVLELYPLWWKFYWLI